ncbi:unnamed protein product [Cuscuta epithymum]|uniref:RING-type E3 ubiquitin transferase n=1 Tax=Cuscuta epithymum TaxID=186058 RepID=A0AAV0CNS1_9ASTE|nr:unnamed protein product [Cuscuta epithymum]
MASEAEDSANMEFSFLLPFLLDFPNPDQVQEYLTSSPDSPGRIILINPVTRGVLIINAVPGDLFSKDGHPPASKASIDALRSVEVSGEEGEKPECVICLEELAIGGVAKEMPCQHRYHKDCIEKWLGIHGSCPVCRYEMPPEVEKKEKNSDGVRRGGVVVGFTVSHRIDGDVGRSVPDESDEEEEA